MSDPHAEIALGTKAKHAYELYVRDFIERVEKQLYDNFQACPVGQDETVLEIKRLSAALAALKQAILSDIETGRMAELQLAKTEKH